MEEKLMTKEFEEYVRETLQLKKTAGAGMYSPLVLAYIGDAVYELIIRTRIVNEGNCPVNQMHRKSSSLVKAAAQAELIHLIMEDLTPEEQAVYKRGRNAKSATAAKNATIQDYRTATGFEALVGYLYLNGEKERLIELVGLALEKKGELKRK
ncbi:MAG: ribonuclease III [Lachnospiraceae bacterium]|nr:ribonuclease III [Lachnospiraceae bacterium]